MMHGPQRASFDLEFALPSECARQLASGEADIGIVPVAALLDGDYGIFRGAGIACRGAVRSILLVSKVPFSRIRTLATDSGSRSSVLLCRIILSKKYRCEPECVSLPADLESMLEAADAALIIGDPALRMDPAALRAQGFHVADLGQEWMELTGLPMVFAVWAGAKHLVNAELEAAFVDSYRFGREHIDEIVRSEHEARGVSIEAAREYFDRYIVFELGDIEYAGMRRYLEFASEILRIPVTAGRQSL
jgi:predicted solute-binding protein